MSQYFPKHIKVLKEMLNLNQIFQVYATKADLENAAGADKSKLAAKSGLASLKAKIDVDKLKAVPVDLI